MNEARTGANAPTTQATPLLSVCLITYNHAPFIRQSIDGVLAQTVTFPWEFIIADDCSTDGTRDILLAYQRQHPELIRLILQPTNVGPALNWLSLMAAPVGKYIAYCEGDDFWTDVHKLQKQADFLEANSDYVLCFTRGVIQNTLTNLNRVAPASGEPWDVTIEDFIATNSQLSATCVHRVLPATKTLPDWFRHVPFGDLALYIWLLHSTGLKARCLSDITCVYRVHGSGAYQAFTGSRPGLIKLRLRHVAFLRQLRTHLLADRQYRANITAALSEHFRGLNELYAETHQFGHAIWNVFHSSYCTRSLRPAYNNATALVTRTFRWVAKRLRHTAGTLPEQ
jgi:glycosyltransferase involved in cell wall biosynthesis